MSEELLRRLKANAEDVTEEFGKLYGKMACKAQYDKAREKEENKPKIVWKLKYREFDSVHRKDLVKGYIDMQQGGGPGAMSGWERVFLVEREDYALEIYNNKQDYENLRNRRTCIQPCGYKVIESKVRKEFEDFIRPVASRLGVEASNLVSSTELPDDCWALFHPQRTKYVFRECQEIVTCCICCCCWSGSAGDLDEDVMSKADCVQLLKTCVLKAHPRTTNTILGEAFDEACKRIPSKVKELKGWEDDGFEDEMLLEMLMTACIPPLEDSILEEVKQTLPPTGGLPIGNLVARVLIPLWYTTYDKLKQTIQTVVKVTWNRIQKTVTDLLERIKPVIQGSLTPITTVHNKILEKVKSISQATLGTLIAKLVTPFLEPAITAFHKPLAGGFKYVRDIYVKEVTVANLPTNVEERKEFLDIIPRRRETLQGLKTNQLAENLTKVTVSSNSVLSVVDEVRRELTDESAAKEDVKDKNAEKLSMKAAEIMLKCLDALVYTLQPRLEGEAMSENLMEILISVLLEDFESDVIIKKSEIVKEGTRTLLMKFVRKEINSNKELEKQLKKADDDIPGEMQDFLTASGVFDDLLDLTVGEAIDTMVEEVFT